MLTERDIQTADNIAESYFALAESYAATSSAKPPITGYMSRCCRASVRKRKGDVKVGEHEHICTKCDRLTDAMSLHSLPGMSAKGGWDPARTCGPAFRGPAEHPLYINPTPSRDTGAADARALERYARIRPYLPLFVSPRDWPRGEWERALLGWRMWIFMVKDFEILARDAKNRGADVVLWSKSRMEQRTDAARALVLYRKRNHRKKTIDGAEWWKRKSRERLLVALAVEA